MSFNILRHVGLSTIVAATSLACSGSDAGENAATGGAGVASGGAGVASGGAVSGGSWSSGGSIIGSGGANSGGAVPGSGGSSSGGAVATGGAAPSSCDVMPIMQTSCSGIICHGSPGSPANYNTDLFNPPPGQTIGDMLIGREANYELVANSSTCPTTDPELLIDPSAPSESLILKKIMGTQACGVKMPNSQAIALDQTQIDCFVEWVNDVTGHEGMGGSGAGGAGTGGAATGGMGSGGNAGAGVGGATSAIPPTFETVQTILTENVTTCVGSDCHGGHEGRLDLQVNAGLLERLTSSASEVCDMPIVAPGNPEGSALVKVLREGCGEVSPTCQIGTECIPRMPIGCTEGVDCIPEDYVIAVEQWIAEGAQP